MLAIINLAIFNICLKHFHELEAFNFLGNLPLTF